MQGLLPVAEKVTKQKLSSQKIRVTQVCGSIEGKRVIEIVKELKEKKEAVERKKEDKLKEKQESKEAFLRCKNECVSERNM